MIHLKENSVFSNGLTRRRMHCFFARYARQEKQAERRNRMTLPDCHDRIGEDCAGGRKRL